MLVQEPKKILKKWIDELESMAVDMAGSLGEETDEVRAHLRRTAGALRAIVDSSSLVHCEQACLRAAVAKLEEDS